MCRTNSRYSHIKKNTQNVHPKQLEELKHTNMFKSLKKVGNK